MLWECSAGPLPGQALVVLEPDVLLATHRLPCEEGPAQERSRTPEFVAQLRAAAPGDPTIERLLRRTGLAG